MLESLINCFPILMIIVFIFIGIIYTKINRIKRLERQLYSYRKFEKSDAYECYLERVRQIEKEGHTLEKDKIHGNLGELVGASAGYLTSYLNNMKSERLPNVKFTFKHGERDGYPWLEDKREQTPQRRKLIKAITLILAELERIKN